MEKFTRYKDQCTARFQDYEQRIQELGRELLSQATEKEENIKQLQEKVMHTLRMLEEQQQVIEQKEEKIQNSCAKIRYIGSRVRRIHKRCGI